LILPDPTAMEFRLSHASRALLHVGARRNAEYHVANLPFRGGHARETACNPP